MERFTIKVDGVLKSRLNTLCRLCGMDNPNKIKILDTNHEWIDADEPPLSTKILDCVGLQVNQ